MRIDKFLSEKYGSRTKAAEAVAGGLVKVNGNCVVPSYDVKESDVLSFYEPEEYFVSNGGYKLSKALKDFSFNVEGKIIADIGASNGGFTDCLLQRGAKHIYCIDVGESQLDNRLLGEKVTVIDNFNARNLTPSVFKTRPDGAVIDVSFISLTYILKNVADVLPEHGFIIALIKPQFECESKNVGKNGIVRDPTARKKIIKKIYDFALNCNLYARNLTTAPVKPDKNVEYLILLTKNSSSGRTFEELYNLVKF